MEIYKNCFDNYEISNFGNVRRKLLGGGYINIVGSILKRGGGYKYFQVQRQGKRKNFLFHHLVAKHFIGERPENMVIDHIDRNSLNNHIDNLRYCSFKENSKNQDRYRHDIEEQNIRRRKNILHSIYYFKKREGNRRYRKRGTGQIVKTKYNTYTGCITINKIRYQKNFKTEKEAEDFLLFTRNNII